MDVRITGLRLRQLTGIMEHEQPFWEERLARPIDVYPEHKARTAAEGYWMPQPIGSGRSRVISVFLEIDTDEGVTGLAGPIPHEVAWVIDREFRALLQDVDPLATERVWDLMYREAVHGRKGTTMMAISAIDCALWDLKGRWLQQPVYRLLGGPVRPSAPAYASMLGYSIEPELAHKRTREKVAEGFRALKWFPRWGPTDGREGMARNIELAETLRDAAGPDVDIMLDAWMTWNRPYTLEFARRVAHLDIRWIEEPVMPDKIELCAEIRHLSPVPIATGEHEYTRWGQKALLDAGAADVLQADTFWAGGLSEMVKICTLASTYDIPVIAHGHSVPANTHLTMAMPELLAPMVEYLVKWNELLQFFWREPVKPVGGMITVSDRPGLGVEIDPSKIESEEELQWSTVPNMTGSVQVHQQTIEEGE
jgi:L-rhamnonate dehydratase